MAITMEALVARAKAFCKGRKMPITHMEFKKASRKPVPDPPYVVWLRRDSVRGSDNAGRLLVDVDGSFELYTDRNPNPELEEAFEAEVLPDIDYEKEQVGISSENLVQTSYDFRILQKRLKNG